MALLSPELQQMNDVLQSERSKTEKLQGFLEHAESDVEQLTNQLEEHNIRLSSLESEKGSLSRQLAAAKTGDKPNFNSSSTLGLNKYLQRPRRAVNHSKESAIRLRAWKRSSSEWRRICRSLTYDLNKKRNPYLLFNLKKLPCQLPWNG